MQRYLHFYLFVRFRYVIISMMILPLAACGNTLDKLEKIGKEPHLNKIENPQVKPNYQPLTWPMPKAQPEAKIYANSLWQPGARSFFRDQRASRVGDILRVKVDINDSAELDSESTSERSGSEDMGVTQLFAGWRGKLLPGAAADKLLDLNSSSDIEGTGEIGREEKINMQVSAIVTQVLPNGNLVIGGSQEIRVNFEVRELSVQGVVRPEDIGTDNTIDANQIAEARISYGGRGQISDVQQPRWGYQVIDAISPF